MRKTPRAHPKIVTGINSSYHPAFKAIVLTAQTEEEAIENLHHELAHWTFTMYLTSRECDDLIISGILASDHVTAEILNAEELSKKKYKSIDDLEIKVTGDSSCAIERFANMVVEICSRKSSRYEHLPIPSKGGRSAAPRKAKVV